MTEVVVLLARTMETSNKCFDSERGEKMSERIKMEKISYTKIQCFVLV